MPKLSAGITNRALERWRRQKILTKTNYMTAIEYLNKEGFTDMVINPFDLPEFRKTIAQLMEEYKALHKCEHCGVMTTQSDQECYKAKAPKKTQSVDISLPVTDINVTVYGKYSPGRPGSFYRSNGDPGDPPESSQFEIERVMWCDIDITDCIEKDLIPFESIEEECIEKIEIDNQDARVEAAEENE